MYIGNAAHTLCALEFNKVFAVVLQQSLQRLHILGKEALLEDSQVKASPSYVEFVCGLPVPWSRTHDCTCHIPNPIED